MLTALIVGVAAFVLLVVFAAIIHKPITRCPVCYSPDIEEFFHQNHGVCTRGLECPSCGLHKWVDF